VGLTTAYAAGLRASEAGVRQVADLDSGRMVPQVLHGKGAKDRTVMLSAVLPAILRTYRQLARPRPWLFPGRGPDNAFGAVPGMACKALLPPFLRVGPDVALRQTSNTHILFTIR
jgi:integrase/recombinase XerD